MSSFVVMRLLESAPRRYDLGIRLLSLGHSEQVHARMAELVEAGERILDVGCGTGSLALRCAERGGRVTGIDISPRMLDVAREKIAAAGLGDRVELREMSAIDLDEAFPGGSFDVVMSCLVFSELSEEEQRFVLRECHRMLPRGGCLVVADEVVPQTWPLRVLSRAMRLPLVMLTYVLTQTTTGAVADPEGMIASAGFTIRAAEHSLLGGLALVVAEKSKEA